MAARFAQKSRFSRFLSTLLVIAFLGAVAWMAAELDPAEPDIGGVARASDGDSFHLGAERVRLLGIDAPELVQTCKDGKGTAWPCGQKARDRMAALLRSGKVTCAPDGQDRFGRVLAHCTVGKRDIGAIMVSEGWAIASDGYGSEEQQARKARRGIWQGTFQTPRQFRDEHAGQGRSGLFDGFF